MIDYRKLIVHKIIRLKTTSNLVVLRRNKKIKVNLHFLESISFIVMYILGNSIYGFPGLRGQKKPLGIS